MANSGSDTAAAINRAAAAISSTDPRYRVPEERTRKGYWSRFWCFGSQKRGKQIVPSLNADGAAASSGGWATVGPAQAGVSLAPPSSPASLINSSVQSPASFTLPLSAASEGMFSPGPANMMFTIGPYAHETQLVSPPVFSTFTTEPSTASLTPPPELAHLTTPSSPDVPFAQLLASSLEAKSIMRQKKSPGSPFSLASPGEAAAGDLRASCFYQGTRVGHLISPPSGFPGSGTCFPLPDIELNLISPASGFPSSGTSSPLPDIEFNLISPASGFIGSGTSSPLPDIEFSAQPSMQSGASISTLPLNLLESSDCGSRKTLFLDECNGTSCERDVDLNFRSNVGLQGSTCSDSFSLTIESFRYKDAWPSASVSWSRNERDAERPMSTELFDELPSHSLPHKPCQPSSADSEDVYGKPAIGEIFTTHLTKAAEKREDKGLETWRHWTGLSCDERQNLTAKGNLNVNAAQFEGLSKSSVPPQTIKEYDTKQHQRTQFEEEKEDFCIGLQEFHQEPDVELQNGFKNYVLNVETVGCRRCGEVTVKCNELSTAFELTVSPDSNFKNLPQWTHL